MPHLTNDEFMKELTPMDDTSRIETSDSGVAKLTGPKSRRNFLKGAMATGLAAGGLGLLNGAAHAQTGTPVDSAATIFSIAETAERLAVTFYTNGMNNSTALGLNAEELTIIQAALIEEQIHEIFFASQTGAAPLTSTFSFPEGTKTFTDLNTFITTQQLLEGAFDSAFIAAAYEFSRMGMHDVARIAVQIAMVEEEHRELGNYIATSHSLTASSLTAQDAATTTFDTTVLGEVEKAYSPADNWVFAPQLVPTVGDAPAVLMSAGFLSPVAGNTYTYAQVDYSTGALAAVAANILYQSGPFVAVASTPTSAHLADDSGSVRGRAGAEFES